MMQTSFSADQDERCAVERNSSAPVHIARKQFGLYPAIVTSLTGDPLRLDRIELKFPWLGSEGESVRAWATLLSPYADEDQGFQTLPEVDSTVVVGFEAGELERPYIVGGMWTGPARMPVSPTDANDKRVLQTRSGSRLVFDDNESAAKVSLSVAGDAAGAVHKIVMDDMGDTITIKSKSGAEVTITAGGGIDIKANTKVTITAPMVQIDAPMTKCSGIVKCEALVTNSVISTSYTPGAGNVW